MSAQKKPPATPKPKKSVALSGVPAGNTALCTVGRSGNDLHYRGYDILDFADTAEFEEIAYLLVHGKLPNAAELKGYKAKLMRLRGLPEPLEDKDVLIGGLGAGQALALVAGQRLGPDVFPAFLGHLVQRLGDREREAVLGRFRAPGLGAARRRGDGPVFELAHVRPLVCFARFNTGARRAKGRSAGARIPAEGADK